MSELYNHDKVTNAIGELSRKAQELGLNMAEACKAFESLALASKEMLKANAQKVADAKKTPSK